jgi:hypothetical protein
MSGSETKKKFIFVGDSDDENIKSDKNRSPFGPGLVSKRKIV